MVHPGPEASADAVAVERDPASLQKKYREKRRRYAWSIGRPYSQDQATPPPWALDLDPLPDEG